MAERILPAGASRYGVCARCGRPAYRPALAANNGLCQGCALPSGYPLRECCLAEPDCARHLGAEELRSLV